MTRNLRAVVFFVPVLYIVRLTSSVPVEWFAPTSARVRRAEMVRAFIESSEYRQRFGK